jgi:hypothetical protein
MGVRREDSSKALERLVSLHMGVRVDRTGTLDWDYHTAGAKIGIRSADGKIKKTASTGEYETLLSRRQYLLDASFLVALRGSADSIRDCADALNDPIWPVFLGRKCCVPAEPVFAGTGGFDSLADALSSLPWRPRIAGIDGNVRTPALMLDTFIEHLPGTPPPDSARLVYDVPRAFGFMNHGGRWVVPGSVTVSVSPATQPQPERPARKDPYGPEWPALRQAALRTAGGLCVFCKSPAAEVHHLDYEDVRPETLRPLCKICHDACTMLEYSSDMRQRRIDPQDLANRPEILAQIERLLTERRMGRRRDLLEAGRAYSTNFFEDLPASWTPEGR